MSGAFQRWQEKKIEHSAAVANLMLTLSLGAMAFMFSMLEKKSAVSSGFWSSTGYLAGLVAFLVSAGFAFAGMGSRLEDFEASAQAARIRESRRPDVAELESARDTHRRASRRTKRHLNVQIVSFGLGVFLLSGVVLDANSAKLFPRKRPNQSPEPTAMSVTPPAAQEPRQP